MVSVYDQKDRPESVKVLMLKDSIKEKGILDSSKVTGIRGRLKRIPLWIIVENVP